MKTLIIISKYELTNEEKHTIQDIYKTADNPKEPLIAVFPRYHSMNDNMLFLDGLGDKDRNNAIITKLEVE
jgi:hypothetical protein